MKNIFRINDWNGDVWSELMVIKTDAEQKVIIELKTLADKLWYANSEQDDDEEESNKLIEKYADCLGVQGDWNEIFCNLLKKHNIDFEKLNITVLNC